MDIFISSAKDGIQQQKLQLHMCKQGIILSLHVMNEYGVSYPHA